MKASTCCKSLFESSVLIDTKLYVWEDIHSGKLIEKIYYYITKLKEEQYHGLVHLQLKIFSQILVLGTKFNRGKKWYIADRRV